jgi:N-acetylglucosamine-6-phosphate deacetylase
VEIRDGHIAEVGLPSASRTDIAVPGFIDVHVHGHGGVDFVDATPEDHRRIAREMASTGVTTYNPTLMTMPVEHLVRALGQHPGQVDNGARILGFHLEGPFLSPSKPGAHRTSDLVNPAIETIEQLLAAGPVEHITLAPELNGGLDGIDRLVGAGVIVSLGHSIATTVHTHAALDRGATAFTHVFNAMEPLNHRDPGMVGVALSRDDVYVTAIFDRIHLADEVSKIVIRSAGDRLAAVTDGTSAINAPSDRIVLGDTEVEIVDGAPRLPEGTIAGSILTMDQAFRNLIDLGMTETEAVAATSTTPARLARLHDFGRLEAGTIADITVLDDRYEVVKTLVGGREIFSR